MDLQGLPVASLPVSLGRGPSDVLSPNRLATNDSMIAVYDWSSSRLGIYDLGGGIQSVVDVASRYHDVTFDDSGDLLFLPGRDGAAFDRLRPDGSYLGSLGRRAELPEPCETNDCGREYLWCRGCRLASLIDGDIVVVNKDDAILNLYDRSGALKESTRLKAEVEPIRTWAIEDVDIVEQAVQTAVADGKTAFKTYLRDISVTPSGDHLFFGVIPSGARFGVKQTYWAVELDPKTLEVETFTFPSPRAGLTSVMFSEGVLAIDIQEDAITHFLFP